MSRQYVADHFRIWLVPVRGEPPGSIRRSQMSMHTTLGPGDGSCGVSGGFYDLQLVETRYPGVVRQRVAGGSSVRMVLNVRLPQPLDIARPRLLPHVGVEAMQYGTLRCRQLEHIHRTVLPPAAPKPAAVAPPAARRLGGGLLSPRTRP